MVKLFLEVILLINVDISSVPEFSDNTIVRFCKTGNIIQVLSLAHKNCEATILKLNSDEFLCLHSGEIKKFSQSTSSSRKDNIKVLRKSCQNLRDLINNNFFGGSNELWITLTFDKNKVYEPSDLYDIFRKFFMRVRYYIERLDCSQTIDYVYVPEPHIKGDWHIHCLFKSNKALFISNSDLSKLWGNGFVMVKRLRDVDNIGAYVSAYLTDFKDDDGNISKGSRLYLYPSHHQLYRYSRGIKKPEVQWVRYFEIKKELGLAKLVYSSRVDVDIADFHNTLVYKQYNLNR